jgi:hypothetical protein
MNIKWLTKCDVISYVELLLNCDSVLYAVEGSEPDAQC